MELKRIQEHWDSFPEMSMEERPVLSTDLEKLVVKNPLPGDFYLKNKLIARITAGTLLLSWNIYQLYTDFKTNGDDRYQEAVLLGVLLYFVYFHVRLLLFADYPTLLSLKLVPFLGKIETVLDKYIFSFRIAGALAGFYLLTAVKLLVSRIGPNTWASISQNEFYKWLIIIFLSVSFYILLLHTVILKYKKLLVAVRVYKEKMGLKTQKI